MSQISIADLLARARWQASKFAPYLSRGLWAMTFIESDAVPTAGIDERWRVYVNPKYIAKCVEEGTLVGEILHELMHPSMRCVPRKTTIQAEHRRWNACHDAEIDQQIEVMTNLKGERVKLVSDRITPDKLGGKPGMVAEELYRLSKEKDGGKGGKVIVCHCSGGSGVTGQKELWELPDPKGEGKGEGKDGKSGKDETPAGLSETESQLVLAAMANDIVKHAEKRGRGSVPAGILRWAEEFGSPPPIAWELLIPAKLQYALDTRRGSSPSYARPSRRSFPGGLVLPVHRAPIPKVTIVGDTSGSMGDTDIGKILTVVHDACEKLGKVSVVSCDAAATEPVECRTVEDLREHLRGGGGTDMVEGIRVASEASTPPDAIVVVTDGDTPWPDEEPEIPVVVVLTRRSRYGGPPPAWADVVVVEDDRRGRTETDDDD